MARRILWFSTKAGILGTTIYYTNEIGIWGDSKQTTKLLEDVKQLAIPYIKENVPAVTVQSSSLPSMVEVSAATKTYWNKGVLNTTLFLYSLPNRIVDWTKFGIEYVSKQLEQVEGKKAES